VYSCTSTGIDHNEQTSHFHVIPSVSTVKFVVFFVDLSHKICWCMTALGTRCKVSHVVRQYYSLHTSQLYQVPSRMHTCWLLIIIVQLFLSPAQPFGFSCFLRTYRIPAAILSLTLCCKSRIPSDPRPSSPAHSPALPFSQSIPAAFAQLRAVSGVPILSRP
jgi:hypothetical protein